MEVWPKRCKVFVLWLGEEQVEFGAVELEAVDLAVLKFECANDRVGRVKSAGGGSESIVRAERSIGLKPVLKGAGGDSMCALFRMIRWLSVRELPRLNVEIASRITLSGYVRFLSGRSVKRWRHSGHS